MSTYTLIKVVHWYLYYNEKRKICVIPETVEKSVIEKLARKLPKETILWIALDIQQKNLVPKLEKLISFGFHNPYVTIQTPISKTEPVIALSKYNDLNDRYCEKSTLYKAYHAIKQFYNGIYTCQMNIQFSPDAVGFLRRIPIEHSLELSGDLHISRVIETHNRFVYVISVDNRSVSSGEDEKVDVSATRYNFHSHPKDAYIRHSVNKAWPSASDYLGCFNFGHNTIFHCVTTLEGIYVISFTSSALPKLKEIPHSFIKANYNIAHTESFTPEMYADHINRIRCDGCQIFTVKFLNWSNASSIIPIEYYPTNGSCIPTQKGIEVMNRIFD